MYISYKLTQPIGFLKISRLLFFCSTVNVLLNLGNGILLVIGFEMEGFFLCMENVGVTL